MKVGGMPVHHEEPRNASVRQRSLVRNREPVRFRAVPGAAEPWRWPP